MWQLEQGSPASTHTNVTKDGDKKRKALDTLNSKVLMILKGLKYQEQMMTIIRITIIWDLLFEG